ncbi:hypothetical protein AB0H49_24695 [Nocardia sp. NPDC050713]|uniref:hypothetical protein n=1 Tax=Nocardia sp. NPDC050713 TaxID=3154511 RepID=UPI0033CA9466
MGSRGEIVVIEGGSQQKYYTHWGGGSLHLDLLPGPQAAVRFASAQSALDAWVYDLEAAAVIDIDRRVLLWFSNACAEDAIRSAVFETMAITWPQWEVRWAGYRERDLADYCDGRWPRCLVLVSGVERARCYTPAIDLASLVAQGPAVVETIAGWAEATRIPAVPAHGLHLDPARRSGALWALDGTAGDLEAIAARWNGWTWENWGYRFAEAAAALDSDSGPEIVAAFEALSESFEQHQSVDKGTEAIGLLLSATGWIQKALRTGGMTMETVEDNTFVHRPVELSAAELVDTREAIAAAKLRHGS